MAAGMYRFYIGDGTITDKEICITGSDVNHIKNVLRMKEGEHFIVCDAAGSDYYCHITGFEGGNVTAAVDEVRKSDTELPVKLYLFQGLPKKDKMELIIQKAVELGAYEIIPVMMKRTIVKLEDNKKEEKKLERWNSIAESAAKQSGRGIIPKVTKVLSFKEAVARAKELESALLPYEHADNMAETKKAISAAAATKSIGIFIGPEGGFEDEEVEYALSNNIQPVTLGKRILRTETAGLSMLSVLMFEIEAGSVPVQDMA